MPNDGYLQCMQVTIVRHLCRTTGPLFPSIGISCISVPYAKNFTYKPQGQGPSGWKYVWKWALQRTGFQCTTITEENYSRCGGQKVNSSLHIFSKRYFVLFSIVFFLCNLIIIPVHSRARAKAEVDDNRSEDSIDSYLSNDSNENDPGPKGDQDGSSQEMDIPDTQPLIP